VGDAWKENPAGDGARGTAPAVSGGCRSEAEGEAVVTEEEEAGRSQKDLFAILEISRDSSVKKDFPLIQNPSEKNV
jgi:hypothetical protein